MLLVDLQYLELPDYIRITVLNTSHKKTKDFVYPSGIYPDPPLLVCLTVPVLTVCGPKHTWNAHQRTPVLKWVCPKILKIQLISIITFPINPHVQSCSIIISTPWPNDTLVRSTSLQSKPCLNPGWTLRIWSIDPWKNYRAITNDTIHPSPLAGSPRQRSDSRLGNPLAEGWMEVK